MYVQLHQAEHAEDEDPALAAATTRAAQSLGRLGITAQYILEELSAVCAEVLPAWMCGVGGLAGGARGRR